jgi:hypothetical protein
MPSDRTAPPITPAMKVAELLEAYPGLEAVLIAQAPAFARLKNPVLRRTVGRVATLQQAAAVGGLEVRVLVAALRRAAGQPIDGPGLEAEDASMADVFAPARPAWVDAGRVRGVVDADALLKQGRVPLPVVADVARALGAGELLRVDAAFRPVPLVEALAKQGFRCWVREAGPDRFEAFFGRRS